MQGIAHFRTTYNKGTMCKIFCTFHTVVRLSLKAPIATKVVCFSRLLKCLRSLHDNSVDPDQTAPIGAA